MNLGHSRWGYVASPCIGSWSAIFAFQDLLIDALVISSRTSPLSKMPNDSSDLPDYFSIDSIPELSGSEGPVGIGMDDERSLPKGRATAEVAAIAFKNEIYGLFAQRSCCRFDRLPLSTVQSDEGCIFEIRMEWFWVSSDPEDIRQCETFETQDSGQGTFQE